MSNIININKYKDKKIIKETISKNKESLYNSYISNKTDDEKFEERLLRIRTSLLKINKLMIELKTIGNSNV